MFSMSPTIEPWKKALVIAACLELPLIVIYRNVTREPGWEGVIYNLLSLYHLVPMMIFAIPILWIEQFIPQGPAGHKIETALFCCTIYSGQVALTAPIIFYITKFFSRRRITPKDP
jgi:hypothetical protein